MDTARVRGRRGSRERWVGGRVTFGRGWEEKGSGRRRVSTRPLTPALSPSEGERENGRQSVGESGRGGMVETSAWLLPLPFGRGEGQGEGTGGDGRTGRRDAGAPRVRLLTSAATRVEL